MDDFPGGATTNFAAYQSQQRHSQPQLQTYSSYTLPSSSSPLEIKTEAPGTPLGDLPVFEVDSFCQQPCQSTTSSSSIVLLPPYGSAHSPLATNSSSDSVPHSSGAGPSSPSRFLFKASAVGGKTRRRSSKIKEDKICGICGDRALGFNFDAITCESCKAFFRRNASKGPESFKCSNNESCRLDSSNRRFCKRCRLKRCFDIGMKKNYILTDSEKAEKRDKIIQNK